MTPGVMEKFLVVYVQEVLREGKLCAFHFLLHVLNIHIMVQGFVLVGLIYLSGWGYGLVAMFL